MRQLREPRAAMISKGLYRSLVLGKTCVLIRASDLKEILQTCCPLASTDMRYPWLKNQLQNFLFPRKRSRKTKRRLHTKYLFVEVNITIFQIDRCQDFTVACSYTISSHKYQCERTTNERMLKYDLYRRARISVLCRQSCIWKYVLTFTVGSKKRSRSLSIQL